MKAHILLLAAAALGGCTTTPEYLDGQLGTSLRVVNYQQTLNPLASADYRQVAPLDGPAADAIIDRYRKSFTAPQPTMNLFSIGVSGGK